MPKPDVSRKNHLEARKRVVKEVLTIAREIESEFFIHGARNPGDSFEHQQNRVVEIAKMLDK